MTKTLQKIPRLATNPACGMIGDMIAHYELSQKEVATAMMISPGLLSDVIRGRKGVSVEFALRFELCLGLAADWLLRTQAHYDYCTAYYSKIPAIQKEVQSLVHDGK